MKKKKLGLVPRLLIGILLGLLVGRLRFIPKIILQIPVTFSSVFSELLSFIIPIMIIAFVVSGISNITQNTGKLLGRTFVLSLTSLILAGTLSFIVGRTIFPHFIKPLENKLFESGMALDSLLNLGIEPFCGISEAIIVAMLFGYAISVLGQKGKGENLRKVFVDLEGVISVILEKLIIPAFPIYVFGNFVNLSYSGGANELLKNFGLVLLLTFAQHFIYLAFLFFTASRKSGIPFMEIVRKVTPAYMTAFGTQSSAASIPVNLQSALDIGVSKEIADFVIPLCATIHLPGSMISVSSFVLGMLMINGMDHSLAVMIPFYLALAAVLVAAPGVPGGAIMASLPFLPMVGIDSAGPIASLLITLYVTQDSFGTSINVAGDSAIAILVDEYYKKIKKDEEIVSTEE